jgi:hypothetical protein
MARDIAALPQHGAEAARVVQAHQLFAQEQVEMVVPLWFGLAIHDAQAARHAQMQNQPAGASFSAQSMRMLATSRDAPMRLPVTRAARLSGIGQRNLRSLTHAGDYIAGEIGFDAAAGNFDFG